MAKTLAHAPDADAHRAKVVSCFSLFKKQPSGIAFDLKNDLIFPFLQSDRSRAAAGMTTNVGQTLLHDAKQSGLDFGGQPPDLCKGDEVNVDAAAFAEAFDVPLQGGDQPGLIQTAEDGAGRRACESPATPARLMPDSPLNFFHPQASMTGRAAPDGRV